VATEYGLVFYAVTYSFLHACTVQQQMSIKFVFYEKITNAYLESSNWSYS